MAYKQNNPFSRRTSSPFNQNGDKDPKSGYKKKEGYIYQPEIKGEEVRGKPVEVDIDGDGIPDVMRTTGTTNYSITGEREQRGGPQAPDHEWAAWIETPEGQEWKKNQTDMQERKVIKHYDVPFIPEEEEQEETPDPYSVYISHRKTSGGKGHTQDNRILFEGDDAREKALAHAKLEGNTNAVVLGTNRDEKGLISQDHDTIYQQQNRITPKDVANARIEKLIAEYPEIYGPKGRRPMSFHTEDIIHENPELMDILTAEENKSKLPGIYGRTIN